MDAQLRCLRSLSFLCYLAVLVFTYALARLVTDEGWIAMAAVLVVAWLPMHARQVAMVNNDVLVKVFAAAALWLAGLCVVGRGGRAAPIAMLLCAGLALATKPTAIGVAAPLVVAVAAVGGRGRGRLAGVLVSAAVCVTLVGGALLYWKTTGAQAFPDLAELGRHVRRLVSATFHRETLRTFVGSFNWYTRDLPPALYATVLFAIVAGLVGSAVAALPALGTLVAVGFLVPFPPRRRAKAAILLATALVLYDGFALWNGLFPSQYLDWGS